MVKNSTNVVDVQGQGLTTTEIPEEVLRYAERIDRTLESLWYESFCETDEDEDD